MNYRATWDNDLDIWTVVCERGTIHARGMADRETAESIAEALSIATPAVALDPSLLVPLMQQLTAQCAARCPSCGARR